MDYVSIKPVTVWQNASTTRTLADVEGAANFLLVLWPREFMDTPKHREAQVQAMEALNGDTDHTFREAFIAAAEEAHILAPDLRPVQRKSDRT